MIKTGMDPINGKDFFFTEESFLRVVGSNSFLDWLHVGLAEQGYKSDIVSDQQSKSREPLNKDKKSGRGYDKKEGLPLVPDRSLSKLKSLQKASSLSHSEQKRYLELFQKYILTFLQKQPTPAEIKELTELESLQVKVSAEQIEFLKCLESIAKSSNSEYNVLLPDAKRYIEEKLHHQHNMVNQYPKNYSTSDTIPLKMNAISGHVYDLVFQKTVLQMGPDPKVFLPDMNAFTKPCVSTSYQKIVRRFPPLHAKKDDNVWNHEPCSSDSNAQLLASEYSCDIVLSASVLKCLVDNHSPNFDKDWQIPVVIKQDQESCTTGVSDSHQKIVYLDKPLCPKMLSNREKNTLYHKYALKACITQTKNLRTAQGASSASDEVKTGPVSSVHSRMESRPQCQESDNFFETETTIDDLETFGSFDKMSKRKCKIFEAEILNTNTISKLPSSVETSLVSDGEPSLSRPKNSVLKATDSKEKVNSESVYLADACEEIKVKKCKRKFKVENLKSDTDSDDENMLLIDCGESEGDEKNKKEAHLNANRVTSPARLANSDVISAKLNPDVQNVGLSRHSVDDTPMSPDNPNDNILENTTHQPESDSHGASLVIDRTCYSESPASPDAGDNTPVTASLQNEYRTNETVVPVVRCHQDSPISPENNSKNFLNRTKPVCIPTDSELDSPMSPENDIKNSARTKVPCIPSDSVDLDSPMSPENNSNNSMRSIVPCIPSDSVDLDSPKSPENNSKNSMRTKIPCIPNYSVGGQAMADSPESPEKNNKNTLCRTKIPESPMSPENSNETMIKLSLHPKSCESESDSHDDSLVIDAPAESGAEVPQVFLSPRALRARRRSKSGDSLSQPQTEVLDQVQSGLGQPSQVSCSDPTRCETTEVQLIGVDAENVNVCHSDDDFGSGSVGVKRKRGRPRKEKQEEISKKFKAPENHDLSGNSTVKEEDPGPGELTNPTSKESRKKSFSKRAGSNTLESILQLQDKMLPSAHQNKHMQADGIKKYKQPEQKRISYNLWEFSGLKLLTRSSSHGVLREFTNKLYPVSIVPKLEYQPKFGVEQITQSEMSRNWVTCLIKPNSHLIRGRINARTSEIIMLEDLDITKVLQPSIQFVPQEFLCFLHGLFLRLNQMPVGNYLLSHSKGENYISVLKSIDARKRGSYDLHFDHKIFVSAATPSTSVPWIPIDPTVILPFHRKLGRVPATFEPNDFRKGGKKNKGKGKKKLPK